MQRDLTAWVRERAQCLHDRATNDPPRGLSRHGFGDSIQGVPPSFSYSVTLFRQENKFVSRKNDGSLRAFRFEPKNMEQLRRDRLRQALCDKCPKLQCCKEEGARTVLVLESDDIALTNAGAVGEQLMPLLECRTDLPDEIYLVETDAGRDLWNVHSMKCDEQGWPIGAFPTRFHIDDLIDLTPRKKNK